MTDGAASGPLQTSLQCFAAVARHHGVDLAWSACSMTMR